jgi:hypothetical protein
LKTRSHILFGFCLPAASGAYRVVTPGWIPAEAIARLEREHPSHAADILTAVILRVVERMIEQRPECWLWMYKRWKHIEPSTGPDRHPFYARPLGPRDQPKCRLCVTPNVDYCVDGLLRTTPAGDAGEPDVDLGAAPPG